MQQYIEYNSEVRHSVDSSADHQIPKNLLKIDDLQNTYTELLKLKSFTKYATARNDEIKKSQDEVFAIQQEKISKIEFITIIEFVAISAFGIYQFLRLRTIIDNKQKG